MAKSKDDPSAETATEPKRKAGGKPPKAAQPIVQPVAPNSKLNFIEFMLAGEAGSGRDHAAEEKKDRTPPPSSTPRVPDSVLERFIQIGNNLYFPDGQEAFTREDHRLTTRSQNAIVIQSMVAIAREQSQAGTIKVGGTDFFKKEAWFAASLVGLEVKGYEPTEFERERLVRAIAARRGAPPSEKEQGRESRGESDSSKEPRKAKRPVEGELIVGRLVDHGSAPYQHNPKEEMSYFVRIETERGDRDIWGKDLERAFRQSLSTPGIGDEIGLRALGQEAVTVLAAKRDADGNEMGREELHTHRNQWSIERKAFLDQRQQMAEVFRDPSVTATEGVKRHPELEGSYLQLQMGQAMAEEKGTGKHHREQFVDHLRAHLARSIEYGQPLEPVRLRVREEEKTLDPRVPDRDYHPAR